MLDAISWPEVVEWMASESIIGPLSDRRSDIQTAQIVSAMANLHGRNPEETPEPYPLSAFVLDWDVPANRVEVDPSSRVGYGGEGEARKSNIADWMATRRKAYEAKLKAEREANTSTGRRSTMTRRRS